ncbi:MAG: S41 family peptidase [Ectothiorhodospiraceae bacterium]
MRNWFGRNLTPLLLGIALGAAATVTTAVMAQRGDVTANLPLEQLRTFSQVFSRVQDDYVEEVEPETLIEDAIRGMIAGLDPHSSYLDPEEYQRLQSGTEGEFGGLGLEVGRENGFVKVIAPIDDTPAKAAGIQAGDLIMRIDGDSTKDMGLSEAVQRMRGEPGTRIELRIMREERDAPFNVTVERDVIRVTSVRSRDLGDGFGYVRISQFQSRTGSQLEDAVQGLTDDGEAPLRGLVLDLRNNPGGVLQAAVDVSDAFLEDGRIVYTDGRRDDAGMEFDATSGDLIDGAPMVILVNGGSASASEIVAGALQDQGRAVLMGDNTFGKGSVQSVRPLSNGAAVKLTTARYFTPSGSAIQQGGIEPDVPLDEPDDSSDDEQGEDYAVREAVNLLKGLIIFERRGGDG